MEETAVSCCCGWVFVFQLSRGLIFTFCFCNSVKTNGIALPEHHNNTTTPHYHSTNTPQFFQTTTTTTPLQHHSITAPSHPHQINGNGSCGNFDFSMDSCEATCPIFAAYGVLVFLASFTYALPAVTVVVVFLRL